MQYATDDPDAMQEEKVLARMRASLGLPPDLVPTVHRISQWVMEGVIADKFRQGRVFFAGDAAHRHPPTGGLGLTSAIHDVYNLSWKLAAVLAGRAGDGLLDTYEAERKPVDQNNIDNAIANAMNHFTIDKALGLSPEKTPEENWAELAPLWHELPESAAKRHALNRAIGSQTMEFRHHNVEFGYRYDSTAIVSDGSRSTCRSTGPPLRAQYPAGPPDAARVRGATRRADPARHPRPRRQVPAPRRRGGPRLGQAANKIAAENDLPLVAGTVGVLDSDFIDVRCAWLKNRGISSTGAVLVRPDRYVAFRSSDGVADPHAALEDALSQVLSTELR